MDNYMKEQQESYTQLMSRIVNCIEEKPNFIQQGSLIQSIYDEMNFTDNLSDNEKIDEAREINEMYKRYMSDKGKQLLQVITNPQDAIKIINRCLITQIQQPGKGGTRAFIVYIQLTRRELMYIRNLLKRAINIREKENSNG